MTSSSTSTDPLERLGTVAALTSDATASDYSRPDVPAYPRSSRGRVVPALAATVALLGFLVIVAVTQTRLDMSDQEQRRQLLLEQISRADADLAVLENDLVAQQRVVDTLQARALVTSSQGRRLAERIAQLESAVGFTELRGAGITVTITNPPVDPADRAQPSIAVLLDRDLALVVDDLWQQGAEAIAINGQRLTTSTAIRAAGPAILVNFRPISSPYVVTAIVQDGTSAVDFLSAFRSTDAWVLLTQLRADYAIESVLTPSADLTVPGAQRAP